MVAFFSPKNGKNGTLGIELGSDQPLSGIHIPPNSTSLTGSPVVGISTKITFNSSAVLTVPILGSIRTIRDFTEGPSILVPEIQNAIKFSGSANGGALLSRLWLDNQTTTKMSFTPTGGAKIKVDKPHLELDAGTYTFTATFDYPQLTQLSAAEVLNPQSQDLITQQSGKTTSLSCTYLAHMT